MVGGRREGKGRARGVVKPRTDLKPVLKNRHGRLESADHSGTLGTLGARSTHAAIQLDPSSTIDITMDDPRQRHPSCLIWKLPYFVDVSGKNPQTSSHAAHSSLQS